MTSRTYGSILPGCPPHASPNVCLMTSRTYGSWIPRYVRLMTSRTYGSWLPGCPPHSSPGMSGSILPRMSASRFPERLPHDFPNVRLNTSPDVRLALSRTSASGQPCSPSSAKVFVPDECSCGASSYHKGNPPRRAPARVRLPNCLFRAPLIVCLSRSRGFASTASVRMIRRQPARMSAAEDFIEILHIYA